MSMEDSDDEFFGSTGVMLGYKGKVLGATSHTALDNHIGGCPSWFADSPPSATLTECLSCHGATQLLAQIYAPLDHTDYDRALYVFACPRPECRRRKGSVRALRAIHKSLQVSERLAQEAGIPEHPALPKLGDQLFGVSSDGPSGANPFAGGDPFADLGPDSKKAHSKPRPKPGNIAQTKTSSPEQAQSHYSCYELDVEEEEITPEKLDPSIEIDDTVMELDDSSQNAGPSSADPALDDDMTAVLKAVTDPVFAHFVSVVNSNPDQVLRYKRSLDPLLYSSDALAPVLKNSTKLPKSEVRNSSNDDGSRVFELQLMPHLILELETADQIADGMEWGSIVVATSKSDSLPELDSNGVGYAEEWVGVQWEALEASG